MIKSAILSLATASTLLGIPALADENSCQIEDWRYYDYGSSIAIEGTTTCPSGRLELRAYGPDDEFLGNGFTFIQGYNFRLYIANQAGPSKMSIRYAIINS